MRSQYEEERKLNNVKRGEGRGGNKETRQKKTCDKDKKIPRDHGYGLKKSSRHVFARSFASEREDINKPFSDHNGLCPRSSLGHHLSRFSKA